MQAVDHAVEILHACGYEVAVGEEGRRPVRIRQLLEEGIGLEHYPLELLREAPGWDSALARAIGELELAGLEPSALPDSSPVWRDIGVLWRAVEAQAGRSWTRGRIFRAAAELVESDSEAGAPVLAVATGFESVAEARFLRALAGEGLALRGARPLRGSFLDRVVRLYGDPAREALAAARPSVRGGKERDLLGQFLFAEPQTLIDPDRTRSGGRDGSFDIVEYDGLEDEIEAAALWVGRQVLEERRPLGDIAVLVPHLDPWTGLVADRVARLSGPEGPLPVYVAGGLPVARQSAGARVLATVTALVEHLRIERFAELLPLLRASDKERVTAGAARDLAYRLGTVGGSPSEPARALEWSARMEARAETLLALIEEARRLQARGDEVAVQRLRNLERLHRDLVALLPAVRSVVAVAESIAAGAGLPAIVAGIAELVRNHLRVPATAAPLVALVSEALASLAADEVTSNLSGQEAIETVTEALSRLRVPTARFGAPAIYVGTLESASGLRFGAVRILGLAEGRFPGAAPEDPVLSGPMRDELRRGGAWIATAADRMLAELHRLVQIVGDVDDCVVLSTSRLGEERSVREPSAALIEAATAVGRGSASVVDAEALRRDYVAPALADERAAALASPLSESAWLARAAALPGALPERWRSAGALDLARVRELEEQPGGPLAGILDPAVVPDDALPGLSARRPLSSYRVRKVLECPHRFLFEDLLYFREPTGPPSLRDIDPMHYGGLLHLVVERYYATYGQSFCQRDGDLEHWVSLGDAMAEEVFTEFCQEYPLVGEAVREQQLERVRQDLREYLEYDWRSPGSRAYEGVEKSFGFPDPVELAIDRSPGGRSLFVRGYIDRIDLERGTTLIRDLKSGKPHPRIGRESDPHYRLDLQLGLYGLVTQELAEAWNVPRRIAAAYVYPRGRGELERGFRDDWDELETSTRDWLRLAMELIANRTFPRTPDPGDCTFCAFNKVCSPGDVEASRSLLADSDGALGELLALKEETR